MKKLGEQVKQFRLEAGISQAKMAKKLGLTTGQFISNIERGVVAPSPKMLKKIAEETGTKEQAKRAYLSYLRRRIKTMDAKWDKI